MPLRYTGRPKGATPIARRDNITKWNVLALVIVISGGVITLGLAQLWVVHWSRTGVRLPLNARHTISLPAGESLVYYESPHSVPSGRATLQLYDPAGERSRVPIVTEDLSFRVHFTGLSGRALWALDIPEPGDYVVIATNENVLSDNDLPPEDHVVFLKSPNSLHETRAVQKGIMITGGSITLVLTIICYLLHLSVVSRRALTGAPPSEEFEGEFRLEP